MNALLIRIGEKDPNGYALSLFCGEEADVLKRANDDAASPDAISSIPLDFASSLSVTDMVCTTVQDTRTMLARADSSNTLLRDLGIRLFALLNNGDVGKRWQAERDAAHAINTVIGAVKLRTYLDVRDAELARIPWELLFDDNDGLPLSRLDAGAPIVRYAKSALSQTAAQQFATENSELRVLFIIGCKSTSNEVQWLAELRSFLELVCPQRNIIDFEIFETQVQTQPKKLKNLLRAAIEEFRPHILHFVGHGRIENGEGALELYDATIDSEISWTAEDFKSCLTQSPPRLVLLNACRTSVASADVDAPIRVLATMSASALSAKVASVISMQHDISSDAAVVFSRNFYSALVTQLPIDVAVTKARIAVFDFVSQADRNWALPVCTVCVAPEAVLPRPNLFKDPRLQAVKLYRDFSQLSSYVDRRKERRALIQSEAVSNNKSLQFILSSALMGKSSLAKLICEWRLLNGEQVIYVDFSKSAQTPLDGINILRYVRGAQRTSKDLLRPNVYDKLAAFNDTVNEVLAGHPILPSDRDGIDKEETLDRKKFSGQDGWELVYDAFLQGLKAIAKDNRLTIVFDHLIQESISSVVIDDFKEHVVEKLLTPICVDPDSRVSIIIATAPAELDQLGVAHLIQPGTSVELKKFAFESWNSLAREFAVRSNMNAQVYEATIAFYANLLNKMPWRPQSLLTFKAAYDEAIAD